MSKVLFEITEDQLETGMRGFPVGYCTTSSVDPEKGLFYVGRPVNKMTDWDPEEVIYLLVYGKKGTPDQVLELSLELQNRSKCSPDLLAHIQKLPRQGHPMQLFSSALLLCGMIEGKNNYREDYLNLLAKLPEIVAAVINYHAGWEGKTQSRPELGYMENFTQMLRLPSGATQELVTVMRLFNILHYDHGGGNLSTFTGKTVASGLADLFGSLSSAMCALAGPRHGLANQNALDFVKEALDTLGEEATPQAVETFIRDKLANKELIYGFGHAVLRVEDPRATVFYAFANQHYPNHPLVKMATLLRSEASKVLKENPKISDPYPNVDAISGSLLTAAGFPYPEYYTVLFGLSRCVGIGRQIIYERDEARGGKGTPIIRPKYLFR